MLFRSGSLESWAQLRPQHVPVPASPLSHGRIEVAVVHVGAMQRPLVHTSPDVHTTPQVPQLALSSLRSTQPAPGQHRL